MHVTRVLEELCGTPQRSDAGAFLELKSHLGNQVQVLVGLCQVLADWGNVPGNNRNKASEQLGGWPCMWVPVLKHKNIQHLSGHICDNNNG
jgi:hypothetical protein